MNPLQRKRAEQIVKSQNRLPPGQSLTNKFPVLHYGNVPMYESDLSNWDLRVFGLVEEDVDWTWADVQTLPRTELTLDIHCVTRWSKFDTLWSGILLKTLVDEGYIKPLPEAKFIIQHCEFGFTTNLPIEAMFEDNFLLATHYDGNPIDPDHGYPLRGIVGSFADRSENGTAYFWKGGKWLRGLEFRATDQLGFWERNGYHNEADPWKEQRYSYQ